jgi:hypothetical protein
MHVAVDVSLVVATLTHELVRVGEWVNIVGYVRGKRMMRARSKMPAARDRLKAAGEPVSPGGGISDDDDDDDNDGDHGPPGVSRNDMLLRDGVSDASGPSRRQNGARRTNGNGRIHDDDDDDDDDDDLSDPFARHVTDSPRLDAPRYRDLYATAKSTALINGHDRDGDGHPSAEDGFVEVDVAALALWGAGALDLGEYERSLVQQGMEQVAREEREEGSGDADGEADDGMDCE